MGSLPDLDEVLWSPGECFNQIAGTFHHLLVYLLGLLFGFGKEEDGHNLSKCQPVFNLLSQNSIDAGDLRFSPEENGEPVVLTVLIRTAFTNISVLFNCLSQIASSIERECLQFQHCTAGPEY